MHETKDICIKFLKASTSGAPDATDAGELGLFLRRLKSLCALISAVDECDRQDSKEIRDREDREGIRDDGREYFIDAMFNRVMNKDIDSESLKKEMIRKIHFYHKERKIKAKGRIKSNQFNFTGRGSGADVLYVLSIMHESPPKLRVSAKPKYVVLGLAMLFLLDVEIVENVVNVEELNLNVCINVVSGRIPMFFQEINNCQPESMDSDNHNR